MPLHLFILPHLFQPRQLYLATVFLLATATFTTHLFPWLLHETFRRALSKTHRVQQRLPRCQVSSPSRKKSHENQISVVGVACVTNRWRLHDCISHSQSMKPVQCYVNTLPDAACCTLRQFQSKCDFCLVKCERLDNLTHTITKSRRLCVRRNLPNCHWQFATDAWQHRAGAEGTARHPNTTGAG